MHGLDFGLTDDVVCSHRRTAYIEPPMEISPITGCKQAGKSGLNYNYEPHVLCTCNHLGYRKAVPLDSA